EPEFGVKPEGEPDAGPEPDAGLESELEPVAEWDAREESEFRTGYGFESSADWTEAPEPESSTEPAEASTIPVDYEALDLDLLELFTEEAQELLEHSDDLLQKWRESPDDRQLVTALQRDIHTVKGSARMAGLNAIGEVAHVLEDLLENIAAGRQKATPVNVDTMESGCDHLHAMLDAVAKREPLPAHPSGEDFDDEEAALEVEQQQGEIAQGDDGDQERVARGTTLRVASETVEDLLNFAGEISIFRSRIEQEIGSLRGNIGEIDQTVARLREQLRNLEQETEAQILSRFEREHGSHESTFDPLELDRYSTIQQLSRALAESVSDLNSLSDLIDDGGRQAEQHQPGGYGQPERRSRRGSIPSCRKA
ncbi:MAG: Hpt domain-containing protein, partial [Wenzhouxiangellaceae bacterium]